MFKQSSDYCRSLNAQHARRRHGAASILILLLLILLLVVAVFAVDYGHLLMVRTDLQRTADNSALAGLQDLIPEPDGSQDLESVRGRVREYVVKNLQHEGFVVDDADIEIGRYDPETIYSSEKTLLQDGVFDTIRVTLRRDDLSNSSVSLLFARMFGMKNANVSATATAVLQKARYLPPGSDILPIVVPQSSWDAQQPGDRWKIYADGRVENKSGFPIPGNWGTVDIGASANSKSNIVDQINNGLSQSDLNHLHSDGIIPESTHIDGDRPMWVSADTGLSSGMKTAVRNAHGKYKLIPIIDDLNEGNGENLEYHVVKWGVVEVVDSYWAGNKKTFIRIKKAYMYDGDLRAHGDLSNTTDLIDNAFTSPVLIE